jgi:acrylyl-CoA reductase (NADPH)
LEKAGLTPDKGEVLVMGAAGGVGSVAVAILAKLGYSVAGVTGRPKAADYLRSLGATTVIDRSELTEPSSKPLESERWAAAVDAVGGQMLARVLRQVKYNGSVAAIGLAGGAVVPGFTVIPFLLRGVNLLGIDSVMRPYPDRVEAWNRLVTDLPMEKLESMISEHGLADMPALGASILKGEVKGRVVVNTAV